MSGTINQGPITLMSLPPELRERIYHYCFHEAPQTTRSPPVEPPITYVSQGLRSEALPIYYSSYTLTIQTYVKCDFFNHKWLTTKRWYHNIHPDNIRHISDFRIRFILVQQYTGELVPIEFRISLHKRDNRYSIEHSFDRAWFRNPHRTGDPADFDEVLLVLRAHLMTIVDGLLKHPGIGNWSAADLDQLVKVDPDSLPLQTIS